MVDIYEELEALTNERDSLLLMLGLSNGVLGCLAQAPAPAVPEGKPVAYLWQCRKKPTLRQVSFKKSEPALESMGYKRHPLYATTPAAPAQSEQEVELRRSLAEAQETISQRNAEIVELHKRIQRTAPAQEVGLTKEEILLIMAEHGSPDDALRTATFDQYQAVNAGRAIIAAIRAKEGKHA